MDQQLVKNRFFLIARCCAILATAPWFYFSFQALSDIQPNALSHLENLFICFIIIPSIPHLVLIIALFLRQRWAAVCLMLIALPECLLLCVTAWNTPSKALNSENLIWNGMLFVLITLFISLLQCMPRKAKSPQTFGFQPILNSEHPNETRPTRHEPRINQE